jgi:hypothetical protein
LKRAKIGTFPLALAPDGREKKILDRPGRGVPAPLEACVGNLAGAAPARRRPVLGGAGTRYPA